MRCSAGAEKQPILNSRDKRAVPAHTQLILLYQLRIVKVLDNSLLHRYLVPLARLCLPDRTVGKHSLDNGDGHTARISVRQIDGCFGAKILSQANVYINIGKARYAVEFGSVGFKRADRNLAGAYPARI